MGNKSESDNEEALEPWVDPSLEARVVALVLGEASDFEKSELERAMDDEPELAVFHRRMQALHELVQESVKGGLGPGAGAGGGGSPGGKPGGQPGPAAPADDEWKLSPARRAAVLDRLRSRQDETAAGGADENTPAPEREPEPTRSRVRIYRRLWVRGLTAVAAALAFTGFVAFQLVEKQSRTGDLAVSEAAYVRRGAPASGQDRWADFMDPGSESAPRGAVVVGRAVEPQSQFIPGALESDSQPFFASLDAIRENASPSPRPFASPLRYDRSDAETTPESLYSGLGATEAGKDVRLGERFSAGLATDGDAPDDFVSLPDLNGAEAGAGGSVVAYSGPEPSGGTNPSDGYSATSGFPIVDPTAWYAQTDGRARARELTRLEGFAFEQAAPAADTSAPAPTTEPAARGLRFGSDRLSGDIDGLVAGGAAGEAPAGPSSEHWALVQPAPAAAAAASPQSRGAEAADSGQAQGATDAMGRTTTSYLFRNQPLATLPDAPLEAGQDRTESLAADDTPPTHSRFSRLAGQTQGQGQGLAQNQTATTRRMSIAGDAKGLADDETAPSGAVLEESLTLADGPTRAFGATSYFDSAGVAGGLVETARAPAPAPDGENKSGALGLDQPSRGDTLAFQWGRQAEPALEEAEELPPPTLALAPAQQAGAATGGETDFGIQLAAPARPDTPAPAVSEAKVEQLERQVEFRRRTVDEARTTMSDLVDSGWEPAAPGDDALALYEADAEPTASPESAPAPAPAGEPEAASLMLGAVVDFDVDTDGAGTVAAVDKFAELTGTANDHRFGEAEVAGVTRELVEFEQLAEAEGIDQSQLRGELEQQLQEQAAEVDLARAKMLDLMKQYKIVDLSPGTSVMSRSDNGTPLTTDIGTFSRAADEMFTAEKELEKIRTNIGALDGKSGEELIEQAYALQLPDITLQTTYPRWLELKSQAAGLENGGLGDDHPDVQAIQAQVAEMQSQLEGNVGALRDSLESQLTVAEENYENLRELKADVSTDPVDARRQNVEYAEAKRDYRAKKEHQSQLYQLYLKFQDAAPGSGSQSGIDEEVTEDGATPEGEERAKKPVPAPAAEIDPDLETDTADEPASTFSLHVSDVAFKLAANALLNDGGWPDPAAVRVEEFVNAFDYGDPPASQAEKVSCRFEQAAHPFLQQRNLLRVSLRTAATGRNASQPLHLTVLLDKSGSMERSDREASVVAAMRTLAGHIHPGDTVTLVTFARQPRLVVDRLDGAQAGELAGIVAATPSEGGTNLEEALRAAGDLARRQFDPAAQNRIVLVTDGAANLGDADPESLRQMVVSLRQAGVAFDACGVGADGLNDAVLEALTREGDGRYYFLDRPEDADEGFARQVAGALRPAARNVKVQVVFNPDRVARYRLAGFEQHRLEAEDFRNDAVDAAEMAAAEAGVALYHFEADPSGQGPVGTVSVRFQDLASGGMVERTWTIPYESRPPRLEDAPAPLRLAATAGLLAEKLRGGPVGDLVDLAELAPVARGLKEEFGAAQRVDQLGQMVERARSLAGGQ